MERRNNGATFSLDESLAKTGVPATDRSLECTAYSQVGGAVDETPEGMHERARLQAQGAQAYKLDGNSIQM